MISLRLSNPSAAVTYEIRDYWGNLVEQGPAGEFIFPQVTEPGWYKVYVRGAQYQDPWGYYVGGTMFVIFRNDTRFPSLPSPQTWGGDGLEEGVMRGIAAIGAPRHKANANDVAGSIASLSAAVAVDTQYYTPFDPVRPRKLLVAFPDGTANLAGVAQIVSALKNDIKYWEPRNEPNNGSSAADYVNNELRPFYQLIKSIDPSLKVIGPAVVTIGPPMQGWVEQFFAAGGANYIDGFSFHAYNNVNGDLWLTRAAMDYLDNVLARYNATHLEKWQTEQGYAAALYGSYQPRLQGRWSMLQMMVYEQHGLPKEQNHLWYDKSGGFWDAPAWWENMDGSLNPVAALMRIWSEELFGKTFVRAFDFGVPGNRLYVGSLFEGSGKKVAAIMTAGSPNESVDLIVSGDSSVQVVSSFGVVRTVPVQAGRVRLPVSELPTYVEFTGTLDVVPINSGQNLALLPGTTGAASGTGTYPPGPSRPNPIAQIINGQLENWYWAQEPETHVWMDDTPQFPSWVEVRFPSAQTINNVVIYSGVPWQVDGTLLDYDLQYDNNGQWTTLATVNEPTKTFQAYTPTNRTKIDSFFSDRWIFQHSFAPVTTQKIRLYVRNTTWGGGATQLIADSAGFTGPQGITLREVEVYNAAGASNTTANLPPVASYQTAATTSGSPVDVPVLNNASDPDNGPQPLRIESIGPAGNGVVSKVGDYLRYIPKPGFVGSDTFTYAVTDGQASASASVSVTVSAVTVQSPGMGGLIGLVGQYYGSPDLTNLQFTRAEGTINFAVYSSWPPAPIGDNNFSVRWTGKIQPRYSENYTFSILSDDGVRLWVNGQLLVNDWTVHAPTESSWWIPLQAGQQYDIIMEYYQAAGGGTAKLSWASPSQPKEIVPQFPHVPALVRGGLVMVKGEYYNNLDLTDLRLTRYENAIDFNWSAPPEPSMNLYSFSVRWAGQLLPQYSENYTFYTTSDDGVRLWVNDVLVINNWTNHGPTIDTATVPLQAGTPYNLKMEYFQNTGGAVAKLQWSSVSQPLEAIRRFPEEAWRLSHFTAAQLADPTISGPAGNAAGDGLPNRLKYALNLNPLTFDAGGMPTQTLFNESGRTYMALTYRRNQAVNDLVYDVEVSDSLSLGGWITAVSLEEIIGIDILTGDFYIRRRIDVTGQAQKFIRLKVW